MRFFSRLLLALLALGLLFVASEGALSLLLGRSWRALLASGEVSLPFAFERARAEAARDATGPYRVAEDPSVGHTLRLEEELVLEERGTRTALRSDSLGLRACTTPDPQALCVVLLGHAAVFGLGLRDQETLAAELERALGAEGATRSVSCRAVALPRWNGSNAWRFLLDHLEELQPDVVLYLPEAAALGDGSGVDDQGHALPGPDPGQGAGLPAVELAAAGRGAMADWLAAGMGPSARRRMSVLAHSVALGRERLARIGARCALVAAGSEGLALELLAELERQGVEELACIRADAALEDAGALARALAVALLERGWLGIEAASTVEDEGEPPRGDALLAWSTARRERLAATLERHVLPLEGRALEQVLGRLETDGLMGPRCAFLLPAGRELRVHLAPLAKRPDLYPLEVALRVDGEPLGTLLLSAAEAREQVFPLPPASAYGVLEVELVARDWVVLETRRGARVATARLLELESVP